MKATSPLPRDAYSWLPMAGKIASVRNSGPAISKKRSQSPSSLPRSTRSPVRMREIGLLVGERAVERGVHVVAGAHVAVDGEAQRAAAVGRRVEDGVAGVELAVAAGADGRANAHAIVVDGAGLEPA